jgi:hypothetical protein
MIFSAWLRDPRIANRAHRLVKAQFPEPLPRPRIGSPGVQIAAVALDLPPPRRASSCRCPPRPCSCAPASMPPGGRHPSRCGHAGRGSGDLGIAWPLPIACVGVLAPSGGEGPEGPFDSPPRRRVGYRRGGWVRSRRPCLALTSSTSAIKAGVLRSRRVVLHADRHYYDPLGLPLPSVPFRTRLIRPIFARRWAGQTGLPRSGTDLARVQLPVPRRDSPTGSAAGSTDVAFAVT